MTSVTRLLPLHSGNYKYKVTLAVNKPLYALSSMNICLVTKSGDAILKHVNAADDITFTGPIINDVSAMYISCDERFVLSYVNVCVDDNLLFEQKCDAEVGGSDAALVLESVPESVSKKLKAAYDAEYRDLKESILLASVEYTALGSITIAFVSHLDYGYAYAIGGLMGLAYIKLLENGIDGVGSTDWKITLLNNTFTRLGALFYLASCIVTYYKSEITSDHVLIILALIGFLTQRLAIIKTYMKK